MKIKLNEKQKFILKLNNKEDKLLVREIEVFIDENKISLNGSLINVKDKTFKENQNIIIFQYAEINL